MTKRTACRDPARMRRQRLNRKSPYAFLFEFLCETTGYKTHFKIKLFISRGSRNSRHGVLHNNGDEACATSQWMQRAATNLWVRVGVGIHGQKAGISGDICSAAA